ncbi:hypothetical protein QCA50_002154 [Cerrena zonata]|uniref:Deoxycytidylate deaminase n=1 Tax=Cerrena zonata TaxID=2478898 RepID=A0AAW0GYL3_9APHY
MFIAIVGTRYAGKSTVEEYFVKEKGFTSVRVSPSDDSSSDEVDEVISSSDDETPHPKHDEAINRFRPVSFLMMNSPATSFFPSATQKPKTAKQSFLSAVNLLDYVTKNWKSNFVTVDLDTEELLQPFLIRPFVLVVYVDAPLLTRFQRCLQSERRASSLRDFIQEHDASFYGSKQPNGVSQTDLAQNIASGHPLRGLTSYAHITVINGSSSLPTFYTQLEELDLLNPERLRPSWDTYFMQLASLASLRSNCMKRRVGAILVRNNRILATGYNGTPRGLTNCNEGGCRRCNNASETSDECVCLHAEENALLEAGRERIGNGAVIYCNTCPCLKCTIKIIQTGVKEVVYNLSYKVDDDSAALFKDAGVTIRRHAPPPEC